MEGIVMLIIFALLIWYLLKKAYKKTDTPLNISADIDENKVEYVFNPTKSNVMVMQSLVFIGKADGQLREEETEIIAKYLISQQPEHSNTPTYYIVSRIKELKKINYDEYKNFLSCLTPDSVKPFYSFVKLIIDTQKKRHPFEQMILDDLENKIAGNQ